MRHNPRHYIKVTAFMSCFFSVMGVGDIASIMHGEPVDPVDLDYLILFVAMGSMLYLFHEEVLHPEARAAYAWSTSMQSTCGLTRQGKKRKVCHFKECNKPADAGRILRMPVCKEHRVFCENMISVASQIRRES